jgi:tRNA-splicing ligase RtcB
MKSPKVFGLTCVFRRFHQGMIEDLLADRALWQLVNVATLPGIQQYAFAMPDIHQGYGFPIGMLLRALWMKAALYLPAE